jgi:hypothetical protein
MQVREWSFARVYVSQLASTQSGTSNNVQVVASGFVGENGVQTIRSSKSAELKFYALGRAGSTSGFTAIYVANDGDPNNAVDNVQLQVEVTERRSKNQNEVSLTKLRGKTCAINAPDAVCYEMDTNIKFSGPATEVMKKIPNGTNHLLIRSHGGTFKGELSPDDCRLYVGGVQESMNPNRNWITLDNVSAVFSAAKPHMEKGAVIWLGGCNIGVNSKLCGEAAVASGCFVVAPVSSISANKVKKGHVDLIDTYSMPVVFEPNKGEKISLRDFCARQESLLFEVPV